MGLFDSVVGAMQSQAGQPQAGAAAGGDMMSTVMALVNEHGGIAGLVEKFTAGGMGEQVASWVGNGQNLPISAEQLQSVLGSSAVQDIAAKLGLDSGAAAGIMASFLPQAVDTLTPGGELPSGDIGQMLSGLSGMFGGK